MNKLGRRDFLYLSGCALSSLASGCQGNDNGQAGLDAFIREQMQSQHIPGLAVAVIRSGELRWSQGYGWADIERQRAMTTDTLMNVGSLSKSFVATAVLQCVERAECDLDEDINAYLDFPVRNPNHSDSAITLRHLLTHHSSIADGSSYGHGYACGQSTVPLEDWIKGYFQSGGAFYSATENFHAWAPGEEYSYNNVAFGLLSYVVEKIAGRTFFDYCQGEIFDPLAMTNTSWLVADIDKAQHAIPYAYVADGKIHSPNWGGVDLGLLNGERPPAGFEGSYPDCIYDHPNFADGFLRTSVAQLVNFQLAVIGGQMPGDEQGIAWHRRTLSNGPEVLGHGGGDPGISTAFDFEPVSGDGVIVFANTWGASLDEISTRLFTELEDLFD